MTAKSVRELTVIPAKDGKFTLQMKEGVQIYEKDTFTGTLTSQPTLPGPLQASLKK